MLYPEETFFTRVGCMDGRAQTPVRLYGQKKFNAEFPDTITDAGKVGILTNNPSSYFLDQLKRKIDISVEKHHSKGIIVHGHQECAGHPVSDTQHKKDVIASAGIIRSFVPKNIPVIPVFVIRQKHGWAVQELS